MSYWLKSGTISEITIKSDLDNIHSKIGNKESNQKVWDSLSVFCKRMKFWTGPVLYIWPKTKKNSSRLWLITFCFRLNTCYTPKYMLPVCFGSVIFGGSNRAWVGVGPDSCLASGTWTDSCDVTPAQLHSKQVLLNNLNLKIQVTKLFLTIAKKNTPRPGSFHSCKLCLLLDHLMGCKSEKKISWLMWCP